MASSAGRGVTAAQRGDKVPYPSNVIVYSTGTVQLTWKGMTQEQYASLLELLDWWAALSPAAGGGDG